MLNHRNSRTKVVLDALTLGLVVPLDGRELLLLKSEPPVLAVLATVRRGEQQLGQTRLGLPELPLSTFLQWCRQMTDADYYQTQAQLADFERALQRGRPPVWDRRYLAHLDCGHDRELEAEELREPELVCRECYCLAGIEYFNPLPAGSHA
jgi:hypothetical protein